jgi:hypothetical protein
MFAESVRSREHQRGWTRVGGPKGLFLWRYAPGRSQSAVDNTSDGTGIGNGTNVQGREDTRLPIRNFRGSLTKFVVDFESLVL